MELPINITDFKTIRKNGYFYIDKTMFIKEWWEGQDDVTLITRPRRFGKTLTMSMLEYFFSIKYAEKRDIFERLAIWKEETYRKLQGTYPVISLSFANVKETNYADARAKICQIIASEYARCAFLLDLRRRFSAALTRESARLRKRSRNGSTMGLCWA